MTKFIIPGFQDSLGNHWQNIWIQKFGFTKINQKSFDFPNCNDWINNIENEVSKNNNCILIAHSLGCIAIANWALKTQHIKNVKGALLVAPPDPLNNNFPKECINFNTINKNILPFKSIVVASTNDPYSHISHAIKYSIFWNSTLINIGDKGHINMDSNLGDWQQGLNLVNSF